MRDTRGLALLGVLIGLVLIAVPWLGSDAWAFVVPDASGSGVLGPLVRAAGGEQCRNDPHCWIGKEVVIGEGVDEDRRE